MHLVSRRTFLETSAAVGGGLLLGFTLPPLAPLQQNGPFVPNAFVRIDRDGRVTLIMHKVEMGQGTYTSMPMLLAEELEVDLSQVQLEHAPPDDARYAEPLFGVQETGGSTSVRGNWEPLRRAGATARSLLVAAAAQTWKVDPGSCHAAEGQVIHGPTGRSLNYGALVATAAALPLPRHVTLKDPKDFKLIGTPAKRLDAPDKVNGTAQYGIDVKVPGMKVATVAACPVFGGKVASVNDAKAKGIKGVQQVVRLDDAVAVVADHMWAAKQGLAALDIRWDEGPNAKLSTADIVQQLAAASEKAGVVARNEGDASKALAGAVRKVEAVYEVPFLAHATMEPVNCTVHVRPDGCDIWVGTQVPTFTQTAAAKLTGLPRDKVRVHNHLLGGGFGRRLEVDFVIRAVQIARQVASPVKVVWTREEDIQHDMYRPYYYDRIAAGLDEHGMPIAWTHRIAGSSIMDRVINQLFPKTLRVMRAAGLHQLVAMVKGLDVDAVEGAAEPPYTLPNIRVEYVRQEPPGVPTAFWRGVGPTHNIFVVESFMDELAAAARRDPVAYRLALLGGARAGGAAGRLGSAAAGGARARRLVTARLRELHRPGRRGVGVAGGRRARPPRGVRGGLRHHREPGHGEGADGERHHLRDHGRPVRRDHDQGRPRRAVQLQQLPDAAHQRGSRHRRASGQERRGAGRDRRAGHVGRDARPRQRHLRGDRQADPQAARQGPTVDQRCLMNEPSCSSA